MMIIENLQFLWQSFLTYTEHNPVWYLYFLALIYLLLFGKKEGRCIAVYPLILEALTIFNPVFLGILIDRFGFGNRYLRFFWMLVFYGVIGYAAVHLISRLKKKRIQAEALGGVALVIILLGTPVFGGGEVPSYQKAENSRFTSEEILALSNIYHSEGIEQPHILYDGWQLLNYRSYDPGVTSEMTRVRFEYLLNHDLDTFLKGDASEAVKTIFRVYFYGDYSVDAELFSEALRGEKIDYVASPAGSELDKYLTKTELSIAGNSGKYTIWRIK